MKWQTKRISDFCQTGSGSTPSREQSKRYFGGSIPWVKSGELHENLITNTEETITEDALNETAVKIVPKGALLVAMYGATVGRIAKLGIYATTNQAVCHIVPDGTQVVPQFLYHALQWKVPELLGKRVGGAQPNINQQIIRDTRIPLPSLPEQKRIAAILDKADELRRKRTEALRLTDQFLQSLFLDMFGDPVTNPKGWAERRLEEVAEIASGVTKGRHFNGRKTVFVPYMRVASVQDGYLRTDLITDIEVLPEDVQRYRLEHGDVLLTEGGDPDKLGRGAVWHGELDLCIHQNHIFRVRPNTQFIHSDYLSSLLGSNKGKRYFLRAAKQTTGIASINMSQLKSFPVLMPPPILQEKFSLAIGKKVDLERKLKNSLVIQSDLFNSLVQRAFQGDL